MVVWNYTYKCNLRCRHCYQDAGSIGRRERSRRTLSTAEKLRTTDEITAHSIPTLSFSGGEPFIEEDIWEVAGRARDKGLYISANSNGTLIDRESARRLKELGFAYVAVSIDAADPQIHDGFRGVPGMWARSIRGIRNLAECGVTTCLSFALTNYNYDQLPRIFRLREELGAYKVIVYNFIPIGRGDIKDDPTPEMREAAYEVMFRELEKGNHVVATTAPQFGRYCKNHCADSVVLSHMGDVKVKEIGVIADLVGGCGAARCYLALQPDGDVTPCVYMPKTVIGNLRHDRLCDIWSESEVLQSMRSRDNLWGHCGICHYKMLCGGCRARAQSYFGDLEAPDPGCVYNSAYASRSVRPETVGQARAATRS
jgi:radical SAM protein with 4Fe4S-binding SPASM domain